VRHHRLLLSAAATLVVVAGTCLWMAWSRSHIHGAYFTDDQSAPSRVGQDTGATAILWLVAAGVSAATAAITAWRARRR
jgi:hypothetical protein